MATTRKPSARARQSSSPSVTVKGISDNVDDKKHGVPSPAVRRRKRSIGLLIPIMLLVSAFTLATCPSNSLLCSAVGSYYKNVISPALGVLSPALSASKPYVEPYIELIDDLVEHVQPYTSRAEVSLVRISRGVYEGALFPVFNRVLYPYYSRALLPRYHIYISPLISRTLVLYHSKLHPLLAQVSTIAITHANTLIRYSHPYMLWTKAFLASAWRYTRPGLHKAAVYSWISLQHAWRLFCIGVRIGAYRITLARKNYVDPHVSRMYDKIAERSLTRTPSVLSSLLPSSSAPISLVPTSATTAPNPYGTYRAPLPEEENPIAVPTTESDVDVIISQNDVAGSAISIAEASAAHTSTVVYPLISEVHASQASRQSDPASSSHSAIITAAPLLQAELISTPDATTSFNHHPHMEDPVTTFDDDACEEFTEDSILPLDSDSLSSGPSVVIDIDTENDLSHDDSHVLKDYNDLEMEDFLRDLGVSSDSGATEAPSEDHSFSVPNPFPTSLSPPALEDYARPTPQEKREHILKRHTRWQEELDALVRTQLRAVRVALAHVRDKAVYELGTIGGSREENKGKIAEYALERLENEGARLLHGLEAFLRRAEKVARHVKEDAIADQMQQYAIQYPKVIARVEERFEEMVVTIYGELQSWYTKLKEEEGSELQNAANTVKALAEKAQADLGMDYAWLEDVTYGDWQRYHDLMRTSENFSNTILVLQNTTAPNPLTPAMDALKAEIQDVVSGFGVRLAALQRRGMQIFVSCTTDGDTREGEGHGYKEEESEDPSLEEEFRILPIDPHPELSPEILDPASVVIGKSKKQVEAALENVSVESASTREEPS